MPLLSPTLEQVRRVLTPSEPAPIPPDGLKVAAVAAILTPQLDLLFMRRAEVEGDPWSGHVSFPGGRAEPTDDSDTATAVRETREELGLDLAAEAIHLGRLAPVETRPVRSMVVFPHVFALERDIAVRPNREVQSVHSLPLTDLISGAGRGTFDYSWRGQIVPLPCIDFDGLRLWGLTLRMVDDLLGRLRADDGAQTRLG